MMVENSLNLVESMPYLIAGSSLVVEHALIMVLLLVGLLSIRGSKQKYVPWVILAGVALSLFTPVHIIEPAWPVLSALVLPPLLWQIATRLASARPVFHWGNALAWLLTIVMIGLVLLLGTRVPLANAFLVALLAASLMWQVRKRVMGSTDLGAFGQFALALIITEVDMTLHPLVTFLGGLLAGAGLGLVFGFCGILLASRLPSGMVRRYFYIGLSYLAYLCGILIGASGVAMVLMTGLVMAVYHNSKGLWSSETERPAPLTQGLVFALLVGTWLVLGWQAHIPLSTAHVTGIGLGLLAAAIGMLAGRWLAPEPEDMAQPLLQALLRKERKVFLLLLGVLLLWPQEVVLSPPLLAIAVLAALVLIFVMRVAIYPAFDLAGVEVQWPDESADEGET